MAHIGLLEDNPRIAKLSATMLQYAGHRVTIYEHPRQCLNSLLLQPIVPEARLYVPDKGIVGSVPVEVLILDLSLPEITGFEVINRLRSHPRTQTLPLIFCTAAARSEVVRAMRLAPHATFISKPFTFQELTSAVTRSLEIPQK
jgi:CheY-like chemotaxis protein